MKKFKQQEWVVPIARVALKALDMGRKINPAAPPVAATGINWVKNKIDNLTNKKKDKPKPKPKPKSTVEMMTAGMAGIPQDTKNMGPGRLPVHIFRRKQGVVGSIVDGRGSKKKPPKFKKWLKGIL